MKLALIICLLGATAVGQSANKKRKQRKRTRQGSNARQTALRNKLTTPASTTNPIRVRSFTKKTILVKNPVLNLHDEHPNLFQKVAINTNGNARQEPNNLQHCFKCEGCTASDELPLLTVLFSHHSANRFSKCGSLAEMHDGRCISGVHRYGSLM